MAGLVIIFFFGFGTLATVYAIPTFGQIVQSFLPITAGVLLLPASLFAAATMPLIGRATDIFRTERFSLSVYSYQRPACSRSRSPMWTHTSGMWLSCCS